MLTATTIVFCVLQTEALLYAVSVYERLPATDGVTAKGAFERRERFGPVQRIESARKPTGSDSVNEFPRQMDEGSAVGLILSPL